MVNSIYNDPELNAADLDRVYVAVYHSKINLPCYLILNRKETNSTNYTIHLDILRIFELSLFYSSHSLLA